MPAPDPFARVVMESWARRMHAALRERDLWLRVSPGVARMRAFWLLHPWMNRWYQQSYLHEGGLPVPDVSTRTWETSVQRYKSGIVQLARLSTYAGADLVALARVDQALEAGGTRDAYTLMQSADLITVERERDDLRPDVLNSLLVAETLIRLHVLHL